VGAAALLLFGTLYEVRAEIPPSPLGWGVAMQRGIEARAAGVREKKRKEVLTAVDALDIGESPKRRCSMAWRSEDQTWRNS
jgi:hypothetical protein